MKIFNIILLSLFTISISSADKSSESKEEKTEQKNSAFKSVSIDGKIIGREEISSIQLDENDKGVSLIVKFKNTWDYLCCTKLKDGTIYCKFHKNIYELKNKLYRIEDIGYTLKDKYFDILFDLFQTAQKK